MNDSRIPEIYADGIGKCRLSGGVVRVDLVSASEALDTKEKNIPVETVQRLIMSPQGFVQAVQALNNLTEELKKAGVITRDEKNQGTSDTDQLADDDDKLVLKPENQS